ncbi:MAG: AAA family ATPase [Christensenellales bacterium]
MPKYKVLVVVNSEEMRLSIRQRLAKEEEIALLGFAAMDPAVLSKIAGYAPHVVLIVQDKAETAVMELAQRIYQNNKNCALVLLTNQVEMQVVQNAMQSGFRLVVSMQNIDTLKDSLIKAAIFEQGRVTDAGREPHVISVYGGKGGCGKTTIAVNLAVALAQSGYRTALVDLCLHYGDAGLLLNITAKDTIAELVQEKNSFTIDDIKSFSMQHSSGVSILCSPSAPEYAEYVTPRHVEGIINMMRPYYDFIIVDLPSDLAECTLTAIENSDNILLVSRPDISNLRASKLALGIFRTLQQEEKVLFVLNAEYKSILSQKDFEQIMEIPVSYHLPEDMKTARLSQQKGVPFVIGMMRSPIAQGIYRLSGHWMEKSERRKKK